MPILARSGRRTVDAACEPVSLRDMQEDIGIAATTGSDARITGLIKAARIKVEKDCRRAFVKQTWTSKLDDFPLKDEWVELPRPPLLSGSTVIVSYETSTGTATWSTTNYTYDTSREPGVIFTGFGISWPDTKDIPNAITLTSIHGYSTDGAGVPEDAKQAIRMLANDWFCHAGVDSAPNTRNYDSLISTLRWGDYR